jgi:hypothetical protein
MYLARADVTWLPADHNLRAVLLGPPLQRSTFPPGNTPNSFPQTADGKQERSARSAQRPTLIFKLLIDLAIQQRKQRHLGSYRCTAFSARNRSRPSGVTEVKDIVKRGMRIDLKMREHYHPLGLKMVLLVPERTRQAESEDNAKDPDHQCNGAGAHLDSIDHQVGHAPLLPHGGDKTMAPTRATEATNLLTTHRWLRSQQPWVW